MKTEITVQEANYHHIPEWGCRIKLVGLSLRRAIKKLRAAGRENFGSIGGMSAELSDGSWLSVELRPSGDGLRAMSSQRIVRRCWNDWTDSIIRKYSW